MPSTAPATPCPELNGCSTKEILLQMDTTHLALAGWAEYPVTPGKYSGTVYLLSSTSTLLQSWVKGILPQHKGGHGHLTLPDSCTAASPDTNPHCFPSADTPPCCSLWKAHTNHSNITCEQSPPQLHTTSLLLSHTGSQSTGKDKEKGTYWQRWEPARPLQGRPQLVGPACCTPGSTGMSPVPLTLIPALPGR